MTKQTKTIEDYPELDRWLDDNGVCGSKCASSEYYLWHESVAVKLLEMQSKIDELTERLKSAEFADLEMGIAETEINILEEENTKLTEQNKELQERIESFTSVPDEF